MPFDQDKKESHEVWKSLELPHSELESAFGHLSSVLQLFLCTDIVNVNCAYVFTMT